MDAGFNIKNEVLTKYEGKDAVVNIPEGVTRIGERAFEENKTITEVIMPDTVTVIDSHAFYNCVKLKSVVFSKTLEKIGDESFRCCKALKTVELPETLRSLGEGAFADCMKLSSLKCESKVFCAEDNPFSVYDSSPCTQLADEHGFLVFCGVLYDYYGTSKNIIVPDGVKAIVARAFESSTYSWDWRRNYNFSSVVIPDSVESIGNYAFANNKNLKAVKLPRGIKLGSEAFSGCDGLADENGFVVFDGIAYSYYRDDENVTVTEGVEELSAGLFSGKEMHHITLPESLVRIGDSVFSGCSLLEEIIIPNGVREIGSEVFKNCKHLASVSIPDSVESMGDGIFIGCRELADENGFVIQNNAVHSFFGSERDIVIPEGIVAIADGVFDETGITSIKLPSSLKKLGSAFTGCNMLSEINVPEGVTEIKQSAFSGCSRLKRVSLPDSLISIDDYAFNECEQLEKVKIPDGVKRIGKEAFNRCTALKAINIPNGVSILNRNAFSGCTSLCKIFLPESVKVIGGSTFEDCINLEEVTIPDTIELIDNSAFENCVNLKTVHCRKMQGTISPSSFEGCTSLADENGLTIIADVLFACEEGKKDVVVPEGVTSIAPDTFREGQKGSGRYSKHYKKEGTLKYIVLPSSLRRILNGAFAGCTRLKKIVFPDGLEEIDEEAFFGCSALTEIAIPESVATIRKKAFSGCKSLKKVSLPDSLKELNSELFFECTSLESIRIPKSVSSMGIDVFRKCKSLKTIEVDEENEYYSSIDGILYNKDGDTLLFIPGGQNHSEYTIPESVATIGRHAFVDCLNLQKIVIPATVVNVGDGAFPRNEWSNKSKLTDIEVSVKAGSGTVGENVFDIMDWGKPLVYPKLPVTFVKEQTTQVCLGLGYCQNPEKYEGEYAASYQKYVQSHQRTLLKKAQQQKLKAVEQYFAGDDTKEAADGGYKPNLSLKKPNELQKVEILEEVVREGTLDDLKDVIKTYKTFEMTARALGLAARYRGIDFVRVLVENGATFKYKSSPSLQRKYNMDQGTAAGNYRTEYYLMLVPAKLDIKPRQGTWSDYYEYAYTPMNGVIKMNITDELEEKTLPLKDRLEIAKYLAGEKKLGVSLDEMLFWALTRNELDFADALIEMGVNLQETPPSYYSSWGGVPTYMDTITTGRPSVYWNSYVAVLTEMGADQVLPVLERLNSLAKAAGKKLVLSQKLFDELNWNDASLAFALENIDFSKINQKKALEAAVIKNGIAALAKMADIGWLSQTAKRENLIAFAGENKCHEALAWLMDFKNRTVDVAAEEAKAEAKMIRELTQKPDSVAAMKKLWGYKKQDDGTLVITSYKGDSSEVEIPAVIGKAAVTVIGEDAFYASTWGRTPPNYEARRRIKSVVIPDGVTEIGRSAFYGCSSLESVTLPSTLKKIGEIAFRECKSLKRVLISKGVKSIAQNAFWDCDALYDKNGFAMINDILVGYNGHDTTLRIPAGVKTIVSLSCGSSSLNYDPEKDVIEIVMPDGLETIGESAFEKYKGLSAISLPASVKTIGDKAFYKAGIKTVELNDGLETIGAEAFASTPIAEVHIPHSVKTIGDEAFCGCSKMREFFISDKTANLHKEILGGYDDDPYTYTKPSGIYVHTPSGSVAEAYMKRYSGVYVVNDYGEEKNQK